MTPTDRCEAATGALRCGREAGHEGRHGLESGAPELTWTDADPRPRRADGKLWNGREQRWEPAEPTPPVSLAAVRLQPHPDVVAVCRDLLRRAEAGEIRGIAYAASCDSRCEGSAYELGDGGVGALHLALVRLQHRLLDEGCT